MSARTQTRPPTMSRIALGCYPLGGGYGGVSEREARATIDAALEAGWTFLDTAEAYLDSEERLGRILAGRRDSVFIATKAFPSETYTYEHLSAALDRSLARLQTDRIDLYQLHGPEDWVLHFDEETPLEELAETLTRLRESGKALRIGVCNLDGETLRTLAERSDLFSTQNLYSLLDRGDEDDPLHLPVERDIIPTAASLGLAFLAFSPLSRGLLADDLNPHRTFAPDDERHFLPPASSPTSIPTMSSFPAACSRGQRITDDRWSSWRLPGLSPTRTLRPSSSEQSRRSRSLRLPVRMTGPSKTRS